MLHYLLNKNASAIFWQTEYIIHLSNIRDNPINLMENRLAIQTNGITLISPCACMKSGADDIIISIIKISVAT